MLKHFCTPLAKFFMYLSRLSETVSVNESRQIKRHELTSNMSIT